MNNTPTHIYLIIDTDGESVDDFEDLYEVTWWTEKINDTDLVYVDPIRFYEWIKVHGHKLVGLSTEQKVGVYLRDGQVLRDDKEANVTL